MTRAILRGKPDAGNLHVRAEEGEVVCKYMAIGRLKAVWLSMACVAVSPLMSATLVPDGAFLTATNVVPGGGTIRQEERIRSGSEGEVWKTGDGTWGVSRHLFDQFNDVNMTVAGGTLSLRDTGAARPSREDVSIAVQNKLFFWVDAQDADATHFVASGTALNVWHDVRETSVSTPTRPYAVADHYWTDASPSIVAFDSSKFVQAKGLTFPSVYFGGLGSGQRMAWYLPGGTVPTADVHQFFAVHIVDTSWGPLIGNCNTSSGTPFMPHTVPSVWRSLINGYFANNRLSGIVSGGKAYLDGERIDPMADRVIVGAHLLEASRTPFQDGLRVNAFFSDRDTKEGDLIQAGGDYVCEVLVFTNTLTETERTEVTSYLMRKWFPEKDALKRIHVAKNAEVGIDDSVTNLSVVVHGGGRIVKCGSGDAIYSGSPNSPRDAASLDLRDGSLCLKRHLPLAPATGCRYTAANSEGGVKVSVAGEGDATAIVKEGDENVAFVGIPANAERVEVRAGSVDFRPTRTDSAVVDVSPDEVYIPNASFEEWDSSDSATGAVDLPSKGTVYHGWRGVANTKWMNYDTVGYRDPMPNYSNTSRSQYPFTVHPPDGSCAGVLVWVGAELYTMVTISEPGDYEFSIKVCGREAVEYRGGAVWVKLKSEDGGSTIADFGIARWTGELAFRQHVLKAYGVPAGTYRLSLSQPPREQFVGPDDGSAVQGGMLSVFDDLHLRKVPTKDAVVRWPLPNGSFENAVLRYGQQSYQFTNLNVIQGWTITDRPAGWTGSLPAVGLVSPMTRNVYSSVLGDVYNGSRLPHGGDVELYFYGNRGEAITTFTPPAGRHYVQADVAYGAASGGSLEVRATIGDKTVSLGTITPRSRLMRPRMWPIPIEVNGAQEVSLSFVFSTASSGCALWMDDVLLANAYADETELISNGDLEAVSTESSAKPLDWTFERAIVDGQSCYSTRRPNTDTPSAFGTDYSTGEWFFELVGTSTFSHSIEIPRAGRYRLSFNVHQRVNGTPYTPVEVLMIKGAVTNLVGTASRQYRQYVEEVFAFNVPEPGTWTLCFRGTKQSTNACADMDSFSLKALPETENRLCPFGEKVELKIASGAKVNFDFDGTNRIGRIRLGGKTVRGVVSAETHPEYVTGVGALYAEPSGMLLIVR